MVREARSGKNTTHNHGVDVCAVLVDALEREGDGLAARCRGSLDTIVGGGEEDEDTREERGEGECELHD